MHAFTEESLHWISKRTTKIGIVSPDLCAAVANNGCAVCDGTGKLLSEICPLCDGQAENDGPSLATVEVGTISGEVLSMELMSNDSVLGVKQQVSRQWSIPASCVELLYGDARLDDGVTLESVGGMARADDEACLSLQMLITMEAVLSQLESKSLTENYKALKDLEAFGVCMSFHPQGEGKARYTIRGAALPAVSLHLDSSAQFVRDQAFSTVLAMTGRGDAVALDLFSQRANHTDWRMRLTAIRFLGIAAEKGDKSVTDMLLQSLRDQQGAVVICAMRALVALSAADDLTLITRVLSSGCLEHHDWHIREVAKAYLQGLQRWGRPNKYLALPGCRRPRNA